MDVQGRRAALLRRVTRASALAAALLAALIYAGVSGLPADVQGWFAAGSESPPAPDTVAPGDDEAPAPAAPAQPPGRFAGGPVQARSGAS